MAHFESWQIFNIAKKKLSKGRLQAIYTRSRRLVDLWAANPRVCGETARNPLDRIRDMLEDIDLAGYGEYSRAAIDYLSEPLGGRFCDKETSISDKQNVDGEAADLAVAVGAFVGKVRDSLADDNVVDTGEKIRIKDLHRIVLQECDQLMDAAGMAKGGDPHD